MSRRRPTQQARALPRTGAAPGGIAALGSVLLIVASGLTWVRIGTDTGGVTTVSGWGSIGGDTSAAGENLNDLLAVVGGGTFRPGVIAVLVGVLSLPLALTIALRRPVAAQPFRVPSAALALAGVIACGFAVLRIFAPEAGGQVLQGTGAAAGAGVWVSMSGGLLLIVATGYILLGRADPADQPLDRHRGIQR